MYPAYHTVPNGPISLHPSNVFIDSASAELFGCYVTFYVTLAVLTTWTDAWTSTYLIFPGTTASWQLPATCGGQKLPFGVQTCYFIH